MSRSSQSAVWPAHAPLGRRVRRALHDNATDHEGMQAAVVPVGARFAEGVGEAFAGRHVVRRRECASVTDDGVAVAVLVGSRHSRAGGDRTCFGREGMALDRHARHRECGAGAPRVAAWASKPAVRMSAGVTRLARARARRE